MAACPALNTLSSNQDVTTTQNESQLRLSTYTRTVGMEVTLSCISGYNLVGQNKVTCQAAGTWSYATKPSCVKNTDGGLSDSTKILIGALVGGVLLFVAVLILIACLIRRKKKRHSNQEKFYRHLQEDSFPIGHKPGEMVHETQYRPPSYASAWPALSHSSMIGKREYPFRQPEPKTSLHAGKSIWDHNDYFINKADISSESKSDNYFANEMGVRKYSANNITSNQQQVTPEVHNNYRRRSWSKDADIIPQRYSYQYTNKDFLQGQNTRTVSIVENDTIIKHPPTISRQVDDNDVVVEVRIPGRYLKTKPELLDEKLTKRVEKPAPRPQPEKFVQDTEKSDNKPKDVFQGHWPMRNEIKSLTEFNKRALFHNRDPFLWRPVDTNFGFDVWHDAKF